MKKLPFIVLVFLMSTKAFAESKTLSIIQYLEIVKKFHPIYVQSNLLVKKSEAEILSSRGAFDPIFSHYYSKKSFDGKTYYEYNSPELSIPTWFGTEFSVGTENYEGFKVDPTKTFGSSSYIGISIPLGKDLLIDKRRAALNQAKIMNQLSQQEQKVILNNLVFESANAYWEWVKSVQIVETVQQILQINKKRFDLIKKSFELGERPAVDTLESFTQVQFYENYLQNADLNAQKNRIVLSSYLWDKNGQNILLDPSITPDSELNNQKAWQEFNLNVNAMLQRAEDLHPEIKIYDFKLRALQVEKQLKFQNLLPKINVDYQQLSPGNQFNNMFTDNNLNKNFIAGLKIELPIPLRFGRGEYEKVKLKYQEEQINQSLKRNTIEVKIKQYHTEFENLKTQLKIQHALVDNYKKLTKSEEMRLENGEGSLFMINSRELKTLESVEKMIETKAKFYKSMYATQWAAGLLGQD